MEDKTGKKKNSYIFTRETVGMTVMLFSAIILVMLFTRASVFAGIGTAICTFMYGSFGYGAILIMALCAYLGFWLTFEKSIKVKRDILLAATLLVLTVFLLVHAVSTRTADMGGYGVYLSTCYNNAQLGWQGYTFGGAVCGLLVYPVAKVATFIGAYVIFSALILLAGYFMFLTIRRHMPAQKSSAQSSADEIGIPHEEGAEEQPIAAEPAPAPSNDHMYTVSGDSEIVDSRTLNETYPAPTYQYTEPPQPAPAPAPAPTPMPAPAEEEDKFSDKNPGKKILFENGEFPAESYRRNLIFNSDSYFSHRVTAEDYLSNFAENPAAAKPKNYSDSYEEEILNKPAEEVPTSYVYGEKPVEDLDIAEEPVQPYTQPPVQFEPVAEDGEEPPAEEPVREEEPPQYIPPAPGRRPEPEQPAEPPRTEFRLDDSGEEGQPPVFGERSRDRDIRDMRDMRDAEENAGDRRGDTRSDTNRADIFDDDGEDVLGLSPREDTSFSRGDRGERASSEREERGERPLGRDFGRGDSPDRFTRGMPSPADTGITPADTRRLPERESGKGAASPNEKPKEEKPKHVWKKYVPPTLDLLDDYPEGNNVNTGEIEDNKRTIVETLESFKIGAEISNVTIGPAITRYDVIILDKLNSKRSLSYKDAIALALKKDNVDMYLNYAKGAVSIVVPNNRRTVVGLKTLLASSKFINSKPNSLTFGLGKNVDGEVVCPDITKMPHLLVAGTTGSGKSICLSALLISLLYKYGPEELRLILVDPKQVEFIPYDRLPHLMINEIIYDVDKTIKALNWANKEMERRYTLFKEMTENGVATKSIDEYNAHLPAGEEKLPKVVIILDEFGDLMLQAKKEIEGRIIKLVQKARACGIHLILATQRPSVDCITGLIKSNLPTRIGFKVNSFADSSTIFDVGGAEKLLGKGDMFFRSPDSADLARIQGCFVDSPEVQRVTDFIKEHNETYFDQEVSDFINTVEEAESSSAAGGDGGDDSGDAKIDDTFIKALKYCVTAKVASVSMIQRRFPVGYIKACKIIDWMENMNYITQPEGSKPRKVIITQEEFENIYGNVDE